MTTELRMPLTLCVRFEDEEQLDAFREMLFANPRRFGVHSFYRDGHEPDPVVVEALFEAGTTLSLLLYVRTVSGADLHAAKAYVEEQARLRAEA